MPSLDLIDGWPVPAAAAGVVRRGAGVVAVRGESGRRTGWASVTKLFTALTTLIAVEEGTIGLDDQSGPPESTVRHLLAHASGLAFDDDRVLAEAGRRRIYSNAGFEVLAKAVATKAEMPFARYVAEAVIAPLGLPETSVDGSPAHGMMGPLDDLLRFAEELLAPTLVSDETFRDAASVVFPGLAGTLPGFGHHDPLDWGLGFELRDGKSPHWTGRNNSPETFGHFGGSGCFLWVDPVAGLACAAVSGQAFDEWAKEAWPKLSDAVLEEFG